MSRRGWNRGDSPKGPRVTMSKRMQRDELALSTLHCHRLWRSHYPFDSFSVFFSSRYRRIFVETRFHIGVTRFENGPRSSIILPCDDEKRQPTSLTRRYVMIIKVASMRVILLLLKYARSTCHPFAHDLRSSIAHFSTLAVLYIDGIGKVGRGPTDYLMPPGEIRSIFT